MKVAITGASGLIGSALRSALVARGDEVAAMVRRPAREGEVSWDPTAGTVDTSGLRGTDAVVHLAADPIQPRPLTQAKRRSLRDSRVDGTRTIAAALASMDGGPRVLVSASGVNWYGDRDGEVLTEDSGPGTSGLLCEIGQDWEAAVEPARSAGLRVAVMRTGIVLAPDAIVMKFLGTITKLGGAAPLGSGKQYWPWVSIADTAGLYLHALDADLAGPVNAVSPNPVTNAEFTRTLARVLRRPVLPVRVPKFVPALILRRELAESLLFTSMRVLPERAEATGYTFAEPNLEEVFRKMYDR